MQIFLSNNYKPHYQIGLCLSCGFFIIDFGRKSLNIWWQPSMCLME